MSELDILQEKVLAIVGEEHFRCYDHHSFRVYYQGMDFSAYPGGMTINHSYERGYYDEVETERYFSLTQTQEYATIIAFLAAVANQESTT